MQTPTLIFDHVAKQVTAIPGGPGAAKKLAEFVADQREQIATSGRPTN